MSHKHAALLSILLFVVLCLFRTFVTGWGPPADPPPDGRVTIGVVDFPADNLSYVSWPQQAQHGKWLFSNLYTTTEHPPVLFNLLFLLIGLLADLFGAHPLLVLNVVGSLAMPLFVFGFNAACRGVGLGAGVSFAATCLALGGGGISWVRRLIIWSGADRILPVGQPGPDFSYFDLYPASTYFVYPSHAVSLGILAVLTFVVVRCDDVARRLSAGRALLLFIVAFLFAWIRPYEPVALLTAMVLVSMASVMLRLPGQVVRRRLMMLGILAVAMLPQVLYGLWFSGLPVWGESAQTSFELDAQGDWASGYLVLWVLAIIGAVALGRRAVASAFAFPAAWALICVTIMVVLDSGVWLSKFAAGSTIAAGLLAGAGIQWLMPHVKHRSGRVVIYTALAGLAFASPALVMLEYAVNRPVTVRSDLLEVVDVIHADSDAALPVVLADCFTGVMLPGLGGLRVFCGHWALSDANSEKIMLLESRLDMRKPEDAAAAYPGHTEDDIAQWAAELAAQVDEDVFGYLIVQRRHALAEPILAAAGDCTIASGEWYLVMRMCPRVKAAVRERLL